MRSSHRIIATVVALVVWVLAAYAVASFPRGVTVNPTPAPLSAHL
ncbi:MAG TPA: hypothetical protein VMT50_07710 [Steroidobacteraceae bacterium]|nr:hypothetical protein [Steroidobacteraceae bacterium]